MEELKKKINPNLIINDVTLREGEQSAEVNFGLAEKKLIAHRLAEMGIKQIQCGYPGRSNIDREIIKLLKREGINAQLEAITQVFFEDWQQQIDAAIESEADIIDLMYPSSDLRLKYVQKKTRKEMLQRSVEAVKYAKNRGAIVRFAPTDTTRTDIDFLKEVYSSVIEAGAERISIADTSGAVAPFALKQLVSEIVDYTKVPVHVHCHNDFGLALPNALAAVEGGAAIVDASINGLGERAGNTSIDELIVALTLIYETDLAIDIKKLYGLSKLIEDISGVPIPANKPLTGEFAFAHKLDAHVKGVMSNPAVYESIAPEMVGNKRKIPIGKSTGPFVVKLKLEALGLEVPDSIVPDIVKKVEANAIKKRASLSDEEFISIVKTVKR